MVHLKHTLWGACSVFYAILTPIFLVAQPLQVTIDLKLNVSCKGGSDGAIFLLADQGTPPYFFEWSNGQTGAAIVNLTAGTYGCTVTDSGGGEETISVVITQPATTLTVNADSIRLPDCISKKGYIRVMGGGGSPPYAYFWSIGSTSPVLDNIPVGNSFEYLITVTDGNGCTTTKTFDVSADRSPWPLFDSIPSVGCSGAPLTVTPLNPSPLYTPFWTAENGGNILSPPDSFAVTFDAPGTYIVTYTLLSSGCVRNSSIIVGADTVPPLVNAGADQNWVCSADGGGLSGSVSAGGRPVSGFWRAINGGKFVVQGREQDTASILNPAVTRTGTYVFTGTNQTTGCFASDTVRITSTKQAPLITVQNTFFSCSRDTITLTAHFDTLYARFDGWTGPNGFSTINRAPKVTVPGNFTVSVTDTLNGCVGQAILTVSVDTTPPTLILPVGLDTLSCQQPVVLAIANNDTLYNNAPYIYEWNGPEGFATTGRNTLLSLPGLYSIVVTDTINDCTNGGNISVIAGPTYVSARAGADTVLTCADPSITLDGSASSQGMSYTWTTADGNIVSGANTLAPVVNAAGTYMLNIFDPVGGCESSDEVVVSLDQTPPVVSAQGGTLSCAVTTAAINGSVTPSNAQVNWSGPNNFNSDSIANTVQTAGAYILLATSANGCTATATATVAADTIAPVLTVSNDTITCLSNTAELTASAGGGPITYAWNGPNGFTASDPSIQVNQAGDYTATAVNTENGCSSVAVAMVVLNAALPTADAGPDDFLHCNVSILKLNGSGSTLGGAISFAWTTPDGNIVSGETTVSPRVDQAGTYILTVSNQATGCSVTDTMLVIQRTPVTVSVENVQNAPCFGSAEGVAIATAGGGSGSYQYGWSNGAQSATVTGLVAGIYTVLVIDGDGCAASESVIITQPNRLNANAAATPETFGGQNDGTATAAPAGGVGPYTYAWSNNATTPSIDNLAPGTYTVTVTDDNGCSVVESVTVNASNCFLSASVTTSDLSCAGANDGSANISLSNAPAPVSFNWSNGGNQSSIQNVAAGIYTVTVTDANSCSIVRTVTISSPQALSASIVAKEDVVCADATEGLLAASASGGTQPYSYNWSNGAVQSVANNLGVGDYTVTVVDGNGCTQVITGTIAAADTVPPVVFVTDFLISLDDNGKVNLLPEYFVTAALDVECEIASLVVEPSSFECGDVGTHVVNIIATDLNGNVTVKPADLVIVDNAFPILSCPSNLTVGLCDAIINYPDPTVTDNCPVDQGLIVQTSGLTPGSLFPVGTTLQTYTYTDDNGNTGNCSFSFTVLDLPSIVETVSPADCPSDCSGKAILNISGNAQPYSVEWSSGSTDLTQTNLCPGVYSYTITDGADCKTVFSLTVAAVDDEAPVLNLQLAVANLDANGQVVLDPAIFDNGSSDNCGIASWTVFPDAFDCSDIGTHTVTLTAADSSGNSSSKNVQVVIADNTPPTLTCPPGIVAGACENMVTFALPAFADNCSATPVNIALISGLASGSIFPVGTTLQVFQATDGSTNQSICLFTVEVSGAPTLTSSIQPAKCFNECNGAVSLTVTGGNAPLSFLWNTGQTTTSVSGLCAGPATITITDADGCQTTISFPVTQPDPIGAFVDTIAKDAGGAGIGFIKITVNGGTPPYGFAWKKAGSQTIISTSEDPASLKKGFYTVNITDANGCNFVRDSIYVDDVIATQEPFWANGLTLAPNPADDYVQLIFSEAPGMRLSCRITDLSGRIVSAFQMDQHERTLKIQIADLPSGLWLLRLESEEGEAVVRKLIRR
jgi:hypothetical protein